MNDQSPHDQHIPPEADDAPGPRAATVELPLEQYIARLPRGVALVAYQNPLPVPQRVRVEIDHAEWARRAAVDAQGRRKSVPVHTVVTAEWAPGASVEVPATWPIHVVRGDVVVAGLAPLLVREGQTYSAARELVGAIADRLPHNDGVQPSELASTVEAMTAAQTKSDQPETFAARARSKRGAS